MHKSPVLTWITATALAAGIACLAALHFVLGHTVDPLREPVSVYAVLPGGELLFAVAGLGYAVACAAVALRVRQPWHRWTFAATAVMFVVVVVFRTDAAKTVSSASGYVHRYSAAVAFVLLTILGWTATRNSRGGTRWLLGALTALSAALLAFNAFDIMLPWGADGLFWRGARQRVMLLLQAAMILLMATSWPLPAAATVGARDHRPREGARRRHSELTVVKAL